MIYDEERKNYEDDNFIGFDNVLFKFSLLEISVRANFLFNVKFDESGNRKNDKTLGIF